MGKRGPAKKPTKLKVFRRPSREVQNEMTVPEMDILPPAPDYFEADAVKIWNTSAKRLKDLGMLHDVDIPLLETYCLQCSILNKSARALKKEGLVVEVTTKSGSYEIPSPHIKIYNTANTQIQKIAAHFGFSPSTRASISAPEKPKNNNDPFMAVSNL
jgi:P27 family predicted phage terminase small subunit